MKSFMEAIQREFRRFVESRAENLMIVSCEPEDSALVIKSLEALDDDPDSSDLFLVFAHPFTDSAEYVREIPATIRRQVAQVNQELTGRGDTALPLLEELPMNDSQTPSARLINLMQYVESLVTDERRVIWIFYPLEIDRPGAYSHLVDEINRELGTGSLPRTKLIVRDDVGLPILSPRISELPNVKVYRPELDPESLERKLNEKANDPRVPVEEQAQMHMMLAGFDVANQRYDLALARNLEILDYFRYTGQGHQQSVVLNNIGDLHYMQGKFRDAQLWYERAIKLSIELKSQPLVICQSFNLGNVLMMQDQLDEALIYYQSMEQLAGASDLPLQQVQALEQIGVIHRRMGDEREAAENWEKAVAISRELRHEEGQKSNLEHLRDLYRELGNSRRRAACDTELSQLAS
ncbi:MAG TPA: tetratricopeptide repeat protein [Blastocatellia bacterium]|nr:tetratricopeptide repeat protein [Blastocatellia bacterium]